MPGFLGGVLIGGAFVWLMTAAWIELTPASVLFNEYGIGTASQAALDQCNFEDVLVLGDSKILVALDRPKMSVPVLVFAAGGNVPAVDFYRTKSILHCEKLPKIVVLSYSPLNLRHLSPWLINNVLLNRLLSQADLREIVSRLQSEDGDSSLATLSTDNVPDLVKAFGNLPFPLRALLYKVDFPPLYLANIQTSLREGVRRRWKSNQLAGENTLHPLGHDHWDWLAERPESKAIFDEAAISLVPRSRAIESYYQLLVDRFAERGIHVLITPIPVNEPTFQAIPQPVKDEYAAFLRGLSRGHDNVTVLEPIWAVWPSASFTDHGGHVNRAGQAELTRLMDRCITSLLHPSEDRTAADCTMDHDAP